MTKHFKNMTQEEQFEFMKKKGYPNWYPWLTQLSTEIQQKFLLWVNEPVAKKYIQDKFDFCKDKDDITIQKHAKIIALCDPKGSEEFLLKIRAYKQK